MCLQCKKLNLAPGGPEDEDGIPVFLSKALSAPHPKSVSNALELLVELGAMQEGDNSLTHLGQCLAVLSLEPRVGKMVIWSYLLGCARSASSMGVAMSYKSPFVLPPTHQRRAADKAKIALSDRSESDQITVLHALHGRDEIHRQRGQRGVQDFCRQNFLGVSTLQMIAELRQNVSRELVSLGFPPTNEASGYHNRNDTKKDRSLGYFLQAAIAAGLYPNVALRTRGDVNFSTMTNRKAKVHISSVNATKGQPLSMKSQVPENTLEFIAFGEMVRGVSSFTMNQTTHMASPLPLLLLCGQLHVRPARTPESEEKDSSLERPKMAILSVDDWIVFQCEEEVASNLVVLRRRLDEAFWHAIAKPSDVWNTLNACEKHALDSLGDVLRSAHHAAPDR
jgi:HrpA-like RNA helicase